MDVVSYVQTIVALLAFLIVCWVFRIRLPNRSEDRKGSTKLNKVPEPCRPLPFIGHLHLLSGGVPFFRPLSILADKYGPIISLKFGCHQTLVVSSKEIAKEVLTKNDIVFGSRADLAVGRYIGYNNACFGFAPYGEYWREMRKITTLELLSRVRIEKLSHVRDTEIYSFVKDLHSSCVKDLDDLIQVSISKLFENLTFNIHLQMVAGKRLNGETIGHEDSEVWRLQRAIKDALYLSGVFVVADVIPYLGWFDFQGHVSFMKRTAKEIDFILHKWMDEHLQKRIEDENGRSENDLMDVLISTFQEHDMICGHKRDTVIKAMALVLCLIGSGSTSITLTWALSLLLNHPSVLKAVQEELDTKIGKDKWVQESNINDLPYLQAVIKETLRLYPPVPLIGLREAIDDCHLAGYHVAKDTRLLINAWKLQRDPEIWLNPNEFKPDRFLTTHADIDFRSHNFEFIPFSFGKRSCPGMTFALHVIHLTLARLLQGFDISTKTGAPVDMSEGLGVALPKKNPLEVMIKPRLPLELYQSL